MDTRDGRIYTPAQIKAMEEMMKKIPQRDTFGEFLKPMNLPPTEKQMARKPPKVGRNEPCPCGSVDQRGKAKKFKKCCLSKQ